MSGPIDASIDIEERACLDALLTAKVTAKMRSTIEVRERSFLEQLRR
jgi:hypothetical protein